MPVSPSRVAVICILALAGCFYVHASEDNAPGCNESDGELPTVTCNLDDSYYDDGYRCFLTSVTECGGARRVGEGSWCTAIDHGKHTITCHKGNWAVQSFKTGREKRFLGIAIGIGAVACIIFCHHHHHHPNVPPEFTTCPRSITRVADRGKTSASGVYWHTPTTMDPNGGDSWTMLLLTRPGPGGTFRQGRSVVEYKVRDRGGLSNYCRFYVYVTVTGCTDKPYIENGRQSCTGERRNIYGSTCSYVCNRGYRLRGSSTIRCEAGGFWSNPFPTCARISCGHPGSLVNGEVRCQGHLYQDMCLISCRAGWAYTGDRRTIHCQSNGRWSGIMRTCRDVEQPKFVSGCPQDRTLYSGPLGAPVPLRWIDPQTTDNSNSVTLSSVPPKGTMVEPGYHTVRLTATDAAGNQNQCSFFVNVEPRRCHPLQPPTRGRVSCTAGFIEASNCTFKCDEGYRLNGTSYLACLQEGYWSREGQLASVDLPTCSPVQCPAPPRVDNGRLICLRAPCNDFLSEYRLQCNRGFRINGPEYIQCTKDAKWTTHGSCEDVEPPEFPSDCTPNIEVYASRLGHPTIVRWNSPSVTDNSGVQPTVSSDVIPGTAFPVGITKVTYSATDRSGNTRQCDFTVTVTPLTCRDPRQEVEPDTRVVINPPDCPDDHVHGASCTFTCSRSYPLIGPDTVTCERDDSTYPPTMAWKWSGQNGTRAVCMVSACNQSDLGVPVHGALACQLGNFGWDCLLACREGWDVPQKSDGHFLCTNSDGFWNPAKVPDCVVPMRPNHVRILTDMFYYMGSCSNSTDELKREFIQHLNNSPWKDACTNVASCIPENIQVTCGPLSRRKRSADSFPGADHLNTRRRRQTGSFYIDITFEIVMDFEDNGRTQEQAFQDLSTTQNEILQQLRKDAKAGLFNIGNLTADEDSVAQDGISADCPQGTLFKETTETKSLSCAGCGKGYHLNENVMACEACPVGSYSEVDNAVSCTKCPQGWSTLTNAAESRTECQEMCKTGSRSSTGFVPCQPCPPGKYQSRMGATDCDVCPAGTWTRDKGAGGLDQCVPVDARLVDSSVSASVVGQWSNLSVSAWFFLHSNASAVFNVTFGSDTVSVYLYSASSQDKPGMLQSRQMSHEVKEAAWSRCVVVNDPVNITVYFNDTLLKSFPQQSVLSTPASGSIAVEGINGKVLVSGMHAVKDTLDIAAIRQSDKKCMGDNSANLLVWTPSPVILVMPSVCDAVDECLQAPCGPHPCENLVDGFVCHCQDGWSGDTCSTPPDPCYNNDCRNGATCVSSADNYTCTCLPGYAGRLCELEKKDGGWGDWSMWSNCSAPCGNGKQHRQRQCNNPPPLNGGKPCVGADTERVDCGEPFCPVNGNWTEWSKWSVCSVSCGGGETTRKRMCTNPAPAHGGTDCDGEDTEADTCNSSPCPVHGNWGAWSKWTPCSASCGEGVTIRERLCDNPAPAKGGNLCSGAANETQPCNLGKCPECSTLRRSFGTILTCNSTDSPYLQTCQLRCAPGFVATADFPGYTCGEMTGYVWNHQRNSSASARLPACSRPRTVRRSTMTQSIVMNANCDDNTASAVRNGVQNNMQSLPCADQKICTTEITSSCAHSSRSKRDTSQLHLHLNMDVDFGPSADLIPNDTASLQKYVELVKLAEESASMVVLNDTRDLFTVNVGGKTITPDVTSVSFNTSLHCPPGTTDIEFLCVDCPAGSMEKDGSCVPCPLAQYQDEPASTNCKHCPPGLSWDVLGATGIDQCILPHKTNNESNQKDDSDVAVIVGAVCGSVVVIGVVAMVLFYLYKRDVLRNLRERWLGNRFRYNNKVSPAPSRPTSPPGYWELSTPLPPAFGISVEGNKVPPANTNC